MATESRVTLITQKMKLKDAYPDMASEYGDEAELIRKGITPADLKIDEGERAIVSYITTAAKDRDGEIVLPQGADLKFYRKNPVVLFGHDYKSLPIGKNMWIKTDEKGLIAKTKYAEHEEAEKVYQYRKSGFPLAESIGFIPIKAYSKRWKEGGYAWDEGDLRILEQDFGLSASTLADVWTVYTKWSLLEYSDVAVPANPEAIQLAKSKGLFAGLEQQKSKVTVWDKDGTVIEVDTDPADPEKNTADPEKEETETDKKGVDADDADNTDTDYDPAAIKSLVLGMKNMVQTLSELSKTVGELTKKAEPDTVTFDFIKRVDNSEFKFTQEDVKAAVNDIFQKQRDDTMNLVKGTIDESLQKMAGKVIIYDDSLNNQ